MNRLANEASPYLQQHAKNPVDWYPWGEEALALAKSTDRPILLSIGYSACHWCHVMERESFENEATAKLMNELFVCIKVDREERPDLDNVYQLAVQILGRSGGWPLTAFLAPDAKPFFAGTYFPPKEQYGMPGFPDVLRAVAEGYKTQRDEIADQAQKMTHAVRTITRVAARPPRGVAGEYVVLGPDLLEAACAKLGARFDDLNGGFGDRPKFPNTMPLSILLRRGVLEKDAAAVTRFRRATEAMRDGGLHDQIGGGFHRYSTDAKWLVPHFEKMLYDNALLLRLYTDAWRCFGEADDRAAAEGIVAYVAREMTGADGAFFATQDADSEGEEGRFFIWTKEQISAALADDVEARDAALTAYGVTGKGNFEESGVAGATVLSRVVGVDAAALGRARAKLFALRETREKPFRDEKVIAGWNGLMIGALADASAAFGEPSWLARAEAAFAAVESRLVSADAASTAGAAGVTEGALRVQRLYMRRDGADVVRGPGFLDDYAYLASAALDLYEVTGAPKYAATARKLADAIVARFAGETAGDGFYFTPSDGEALILRSSDSFDQAVPSASAVAADVLLKLGTFVDPAYAARASAYLEKLATAAVENPLGLGQTVLALDRVVRGSIDVVLVGKKGDARLQALAHEALSAYVPTRNVAWVDPADPESRAVCAALAEGKEKTEGPLAYVCRGRTCSAPINSPAELARELLGDAAVAG